ncbi:MAG: RNA polymerase sigma-70 factor [Chloroflexi bacterium]|nr:RNA polymerase sigma-70 factor [Chloroflexota bacterium]
MTIRGDSLRQSPRYRIRANLPASDRSVLEGAVADSGPFLEHRSLLFSIAYRMLGSVVDAEDAVQETYLRWRRATGNGEEIRSPKAWLTTIISRVCLDQLGSARAKREQYVGPWLPEPLAGSSPDVADTVADFDSLSLAFLVLLESLSPKERAVFLLHDVFGYDFASIGEIVGESDAYCRQLAKRAREKMAERRPRFEANQAQRERLTADFLRAVSDGDMLALIETLTHDATVFSDGGGKVNAARKPVVGREKVALFLTNLARRASEETRFRVEPINGQPGIVTLVDGVVRNVVTFDFADSGIRTIYIVVNPDKLRTVASALTGVTHAAEPHS